MANPLAVSCPHCGAGLKLKNNSFVGKKVPCPKCKQPFLVEEPPEDEFLSQDDDFGAMDEAEEEPEEPRPKSKSKGAKGGKGKKKSKGGGFAPIAMIAGGTVLGLGLIGGIIYGAMALFSGMGSTSWVKWLPEETDAAIQVRVADSMNAPFFKPIMDHPTLSKLINQPPIPADGGANPAAAFLQGLNIQARDIDTVTVGLVDSLQVDANVGFPGPRGPETPKKFVAVIRFKTAVDEAKLASAPATILAKEDYSGKAVYAVVGASDPKVLVHAVDPTTYLVGSDAELKAAIDGQGAAPAAKRFAFADTKSSILYVAAPKDTDKLKALGLSTFRRTASGVQTADANIEGIYGISYGVTFGTDAKVELCSSLKASMAKTSAEQNKKEIDQQRAAIQAQIAQLDNAPFNPFMPAASLKKLLGHVDAMLGGAQATSSGATSTLTMTLSSQIVTDALAMATPFMPMLELKIAEQQKAAAAAAAAATATSKSTLGNSPLDITAYPGQVIDAGEKSKDRINALNDQHQADIEAQMQEGNAPAPAAHAAPAAAPAGATNPTGVDPAKAMHAAPAGAAAGNAGGNDPAKMMHAGAAPAGAPAGNAAANDPAKAMHAGTAPAGAPAGNAAANDPAKAMHAAAGAVPAGANAGNANGQNPDQPAEKPVPKSRSRRKPAPDK